MGIVEKKEHIVQNIFRTYLGIVEKKELVMCEIQAGKVGLLSVLLNPLLVGSVGLSKIIYIIQELCLGNYTLLGTKIGYLWPLLTMKTNIYSMLWPIGKIKIVKSIFP